MSDWKVFPHFIVRATGFPFEWVEGLRLSDSAALIRRCDAALGRLEALRRDAPRLHRPPRPVLSALKGNRPVPLDEVADPEPFRAWNQVAGELQEAQAALEETFGREYAALLERLREVARGPRFLEAVASSSPPVYLDLMRDRWSTRVERQVASYVQRLCAKNETMSFFGPINYGRFDDGAPGAFALEWSGPVKLKGRRTHLASWMVRGLMEKIAFDPQIAPWLVLRSKGFSRPPFATRKRLGETLIELRAATLAQVERAVQQQEKDPRRLGELLVAAEVCTPADVERALKLQGQSKRPAAEGLDATLLLARLFDAADGFTRLGVLAERLEVPLETLLPVARLACEKRLLAHQLEIPSGAYLPIHDLVERLSGIPGRAARQHLEGIDRLLDWMRQYSPADAPTKVRLLDEVKTFAEERWDVRSPFAPRQEAPRQAPGAPPERRRGDGQFYADRLPMREECGGDLKLVIGGECARDIRARVQRPLDLLACASGVTRAAAQAKVAQLLGKKRVPFWKVVAAFSEQPVPYDASLSEWLQGLPLDRAAPSLEIDAGAFPGQAPPDGLPLVCSVDLLLCARSQDALDRGDYQLVMGDIHDTAQVWGWALQFMENRQQVETDMVRLIGQAPRGLPVVTVLASRRTGLLPSEFPGPVIELGGTSGKASPWRLPFDDLSVESDGESARLWSQSLQSEVALYNGELESLVHTAFALPRIRAPRVDLGAHTPRLTVEKVVLQRETWTLSKEHVDAFVAARDDQARLRTALAVWDALSLPSLVFAKLPGERKPVLLDPQNPFVLRTFATMLEDKGGASLSEMLPAPEHLWLKSELGRHTVELRCTFARGVE